MKRIYLDELSTGFERRIYLNCVKRNKFLALCQNSWGSLFRTKNYKRLMHLTYVIEERVSNIMYEEFGGVKYITKMFGPTNLHEVIAGTNQSFLLIILDD